MTIRILAASAVLAVACAVTAPASAQSVNDLSKMGGGMMSGGSGGGMLESLSSGSMSLGSAQNAAGVLGYCQEQGYAPDAATTVKDRLLTKVGGQQEASQDSGYLAGMGGMLQGGDGNSFDLTKLKETAGKKACGAIADQAVSSFLGG